MDPQREPQPEPVADDGEASAPRPPRGRRIVTLSLVAVGIVVMVVVAAGTWFVLGRDRAEQVSGDDVLAEFRENAGDLGAEVAAGLPAPGVYDATASGTESIGLPGFDEALGPEAPVTVTHGGGGCFTYRADFNSHHWRSWTYCPTDTATFALTGLETWTARKAPGLDLDTLGTYTCEEPVPVLWEGAAAGDERTGSCTGTNDLDDGITRDAARVEVVDRTTVTIGDQEVEAVRVRTTDTFSEAQTGSEVGEYWFDASTGLPLRVVVDSSVSGASGDYREDFELELRSLTPAT